MVVPTPTTDSLVTAMPTVATTTRTAWATPTSTARARPSTLARCSRKIHFQLTPSSHGSSFTDFGWDSVVTQFEENKITQFFVQDGNKIEIPGPTYDGLDPESSAITPEYCSNVFTVFDDRNRFDEVGGFDQLTVALKLPMVLVMSIWDDVSTLLPS